MSSDDFLVLTKVDDFSFEAVESLMQRIVKNSQGGDGYNARSWFEYTYGFFIP